MTKKNTRPAAAHAKLMREIARAAHGELRHDALLARFEEFWQRLEQGARTILTRPEVGMPLSEDEARRWWRAQVGLANAEALGMLSRRIQERAMTELKMLGYEVADRRNIPATAPILVDGLVGVVREGFPPGQRPAGPAPVPPRRSP